MLSGFHVVDGGLGSELIRRGIHIQDDPLWSAKALIYNPNDIKIIHKSFLESGANIILTASYQANIDGFCHYAKCSYTEAKYLIKKSVILAKEACQEFLEMKKDELPAVWSCDKLLVAGSIGPYGACQFDRSEYHGNYVDNMTIEEMVCWHRPRIATLVEAGVHFLAVETIPSLLEAKAILHVIKEFPNISCWVTFSCKIMKGPLDRNDVTKPETMFAQLAMDIKHLCHGETFYDAITAVQAYKQVEAVGVNCCSPEDVQGLLSSTDENVLQKAFVVYPNSGKNRETERLDKNPNFASYVPGWLKQGATIVGGCCGVTPTDIKDVGKVVVEWTQGGR